MYQVNGNEYLIEIPQKNPKCHFETYEVISTFMGQLLWVTFEA